MSAGALSVSDSWRIASEELRATIRPPQGCNNIYDHRIADVAMMFPEMPVDEFLDFVEDIRKEGVQDTIKVSNGEIIDGRHRYWACIVLGIEPRLQMEVVDLGSEEEVESFVWSHNAKRRHLSKSAVALLAASRHERLEQAREEAARRNEEIRTREEERIRKLEEEKAHIELGANEVFDAKPESKPDRKDAIIHRKVKAEAKAIANQESPIPAKVSVRDIADDAGISDRLVKYSKELYSIGSTALVSLVQAGQISVRTAISFAKACPNKTKQAEVCKGEAEAVLSYLRNDDGKPKNRIDRLADKHGVSRDRARELVQSVSSPKSDASSADIEQTEPVETGLSRLFEKYRASEIVSGALTLARLAPLGDRLDVGQEMQKFSQVFGVIVSSIDDESIDNDAEMGDVTGF